MSRMTSEEMNRKSLEFWRAGEKTNSEIWEAASEIMKALEKFATQQGVELGEQDIDNRVERWVNQT